MRYKIWLQTFAGYLGGLVDGGLSELDRGRGNLAEHNTISKGFQDLAAFKITRGQKNNILLKYAQPIVVPA